MASSIKANNKGRVGGQKNLTNKRISTHKHRRVRLLKRSNMLVKKAKLLYMRRRSSPAIISFSPSGLAYSDDRLSIGFVDQDHHTTDTAEQHRRMSDYVAQLQATRDSLVEDNKLQQRRLNALKAEEQKNPQWRTCLGFVWNGDVKQLNAEQNIEVVLGKLDERQAALEEVMRATASQGSDGASAAAGNHH